MPYLAESIQERRLEDLIKKKNPSWLDLIKRPSFILDQFKVSSRSRVEQMRANVGDRGEATQMFWI